MRGEFGRLVVDGFESGVAGDWIQARAYDPTKDGLAASQWQAAPARVVDDDRDDAPVAYFFERTFLPVRSVSARKSR